MTNFNQILDETYTELVSICDDYVDNIEDVKDETFVESGNGYLTAREYRSFHNALEIIYFAKTRAEIRKGEI